MTHTPDLETPEQPQGPLTWTGPTERRTTNGSYTDPRRQLWRQVGWAGLSNGRAYALDDETGVREDPAGFAPLWVLIDDEPYLHNPWDAACVKGLSGEPSTPGARCPVCRATS